MGKSPLNFETLGVALVDHEVKLMEIAFGVLSVAGAQLSGEDFVATFLKMHGYVWDRRLGGYDLSRKPDSFTHKDVVQLEKVAGFPAPESLRKRALGIRPLHELDHLIWAYNYAHAPGHRSHTQPPIDLIAYLDGIARSFNRVWDEETGYYVTLI